MSIKKNKYEGKIGLQTKNFVIEAKQFNSESRTISGYAAVFNNIDKADDKLIKGCFAKSIEERGVNSTANDKIILLWQHDMRDPIGRITELKEDDHGLYFEAVLDEVENGDRALKQLEAGTLNQFSIGYRYVWDKVDYIYDEKHNVGYYEVKEVILHEISVVSIGCNGETEYLGLKSDEDFENKYKELDVDLDACCKGLSMTRKYEIQRIFAKAISLASQKSKESLKVEPVVEPLDLKKPIDENGQAEPESNNSMFKILLK